RGRAGRDACDPRLLQLHPGLDQPARDAARRRQQRDQAGLEGVIDVHLAVERAGIGLQVLAELREPAAMVLVDKMGSAEVPDGAIPFLEEGVAIDGVEEGGGADALTAGPPVTIADARLARPIQRIIEATLLVVPPVLDGLA